MKRKREPLPYITKQELLDATKRLRAELSCIPESDVDNKARGILLRDNTDKALRYVASQFITLRRKAEN